jgi:ABC-2 type transport system ATP-binding protein
VSENIVVLTNLTKKYGSFTAVDNLNLVIRRGEIFGLLGPNGAGKSTTILMMLGLTEPTSGSVRICGIDPVTDPIVVKRKAGYLPEDVGFYDDLTGPENLVYTAKLNGIGGTAATEKAMSLFKKVGLEGEEKKKVGKYSRGMRQRLGLADALIKSPEVIILDEPTLGIDPAGVREFLNLIVELSREEKITVLFSSHLLHQVQQVCDRVGIFVGGKLLAEGDIRSLSEKLFEGSAYETEVAVDPLPEVKGLSAGNPEALVRSVLQNVEGITDIRAENGLFRIESTRDVSREIAARLVQAGAGLTHLSRREYGLDDIYYRYFEGGLKNG